MSDNQLESHGKSEYQNCQSAQIQLSVMYFKKKGEGGNCQVRQQNNKMKGM